MNNTKKIAGKLFNSLGTVLFVTALVIIVPISLALITSGLGYLLTLILPFTLFQGTQLSAIMVLLVMFALYAVRERVNERGYDLSDDGLDAYIRDKHAKEQLRKRRKKSQLYEIFYE